MKNKLIFAIIIIIMLVIISLAMIGVIESGKTETEILYKNLTVSAENETTCVEETFYINDKKFIRSLELELQEYYNNNITPEIFFNDIKIERTYSTNFKELYYRKEDSNKIIVGNIRDNLLDGENKVVVRYYINTSKIVTEYNNVSVLNIDYNDFTIYNNINLKLPTETENFEVSNSKLSYKKLNNNKYIVDASDMRKDLKITIDKDCIPSDTKIEKDYTNTEKIREENIQNAIKVFTILTVSISIINIIISYVFVKGKKYNKKYYRDTEEIVDVVLAETMIDRKINSNKLIMSVIVDQISCGNIIMDDDKLILNRYDNESEAKRQIINMFFNEKDSININDLSAVFKDERKNDEIIKTFREIRKNITDEFYNLEIYDRNKENILKKIKKTSIAIICIMIIYFIYMLYGAKFTIISAVIVGIIGLPVILLIKKSKSVRVIPILLAPIIYLFIAFIGSIIMNIKPMKAFSIKTIDILAVIFITIINYIIIRISKRHVFTQKGMREYEKIRGLNDYILDYSLIKERDMDSVIIWDKYLVYATAFGIPNKVTDRFSEVLMNITEMLDKINKLLINEE